MPCPIVGELSIKLLGFGVFIQRFDHLVGRGVAGVDLECEGLRIVVVGDRLVAGRDSRIASDRRA